jgi:hypothetical protein
MTSTWKTTMIILLSVFALLPVSRVEGQTIQGQINRTVTAPEAISFRGPTLNLDTNTKRHSETSASGVYFLPNRSPGRSWPYPGSSPRPISGKSINLDDRTPCAIDWNFRVEQMLPSRIKLSVDKVGSGGQKSYAGFLCGSDRPGARKQYFAKPSDNRPNSPWQSVFSALKLFITTRVKSAE